MTDACERKVTASIRNTSGHWGKETVVCGIKHLAYQEFYVGRYKYVLQRPGSSLSYARPGTCGGCAGVAYPNWHCCCGTNCIYLGDIAPYATCEEAKAAGFFNWHSEIEGLVRYTWVCK